MVKARTALDELGTDGSFKRKESAWRNWVSTDEGAEYPPEADRYHLFVAAACPWAHRTLMARHLKGLEDIISVTVVHPTWRKTKPDDEEDKHCGWVFAADADSKETYKNTEGLGGPFTAALEGCEPNPLFTCFSIRDVYEKAKDTEGKYTVPILWDKKKETIVSNESAEIIQMFNSAFNGKGLAKNPDLDLAPKELLDAMKEADDWIYPNINNGVYRCGFAQSQGAYDKAIEDLTNSFDRLEEILKKQRFIAGDQMTLSDIRLFSTLLRFDEVYVVYFKTNTRTVTHTPTLLNYCREMYQKVGPTVNMAQIKQHYYTSHPNLNKYSIIPKGADFVKLLEEPHDRESLTSNKKQKV
ncbi:Glutathionyl-hydroquinone reductase [Seminavis robusta]|uniref:Glutathionyl-hydroquinone reductase n=1 Tax=Seminavis robusta TaxID=568900 RepID=A0A9N8HFW2_9STRA|nr:Glutathionyl-hydroquinone reductase [Seminavis robusta]|eukprot:Sro596_g172810.1 Glutathionyl-hydroquinone reductase (355) ;mRNA; r:24781-26307